MSTIPLGISLFRELLNNIIPNNKFYFIFGNFNAAHQSCSNGNLNHKGGVMYKRIIDNNMILLN